MRSSYRPGPLLLAGFSALSQVTASPAATVTVAAPQPTNEPSYADGGDFVYSVLNSTNFYRYEHNATALQWNDSLQSYAQDYVAGCKFAHSGGKSGENLAEGYANVATAIGTWGDERSQYDFNDPGFNENTGHFTQLVWKGSTTVGCGRSFCNGAGGVPGWYLVCEYWPAGNVIGAFGDEVQSQVNDGKGYSFQNGTDGANGTAGSGGSGGSGSSGSSGNNSSSSGSGGSSNSDSGARRAVDESPILTLVVTLLGLLWLC